LGPTRTTRQDQFEAKRATIGIGPLLPFSDPGEAMQPPQSFVLVRRCRFAWHGLVVQDHPGTNRVDQSIRARRRQRLQIYARTASEHLPMLILFFWELSNISQVLLRLGLHTTERQVARPRPEAAKPCLVQGTDFSLSPAGGSFRHSCALSSRRGGESALAAHLRRKRAASLRTSLALQRSR
jgi:hypothetical protein